MVMKKWSEGFVPHALKMNQKEIQLREGRQRKLP
jgi:hypothetical protein